MLRKLLNKILGDPNERELQRYDPIVEEINALEPEMQALEDADFAEMTRSFQERLSAETAERERRIVQLEAELDREQDIQRRRELRRELELERDGLDRAEAGILEDILPRAFAAVREAGVRAVDMRAYDEQLVGAIALHRGIIAEMKTGEGKTLVATMPLYLNALGGRGAHLVTPNDYLSKYGAQWMGPIYDLLGLSVGVIQSRGQDPSMSSFLYDPDYPAESDLYQHLRPCTRKEAYQADITYGTNNEFGFDYLRDNMVTDLNQCVQHELHYAIIDEIDNILIDEARTPLIISSPDEESADQYRRFAQIVQGFREEVDYTVNEKRTEVTATDEAISKVERALGIDNIYAEEHFHLTPYLENALKAQALFRRDRDYVVQEGQVIIVDDFTGRLMYGRRYSEGLHQAIEAKEGVPVQRESLTMATITFQNYFRMYRKLAGMTGTAETEAEEFAEIYGLDVLVIPTHEPVIRKDHPDVIYKTAEAKFRAVLEEIRECHQRQQPVLVGTLAIETSEMLSERLRRMRIPHEVLNAKQHAREAQIIAQAGRPGAVTIATNMAGRGVDILLGGNPEGLARQALRRQGHDLQELDDQVWDEAHQEAKEQCALDREIVLEAGGLHVLGTERYEARRIDNQLRGRSGRQGDPGSSRFYVSLEDELMLRFGGPTVANLMDRLGVEEDIPLQHGMVSRAIENAQSRVEGYNFDVRKHLLEYDDVLNQQREVIYDQRRLVLSEASLRPVISEILHDQVAEMVMTHVGGEDYDLDTLHDVADRLLHLPEEHRAEDWQGMMDQELIDDLGDWVEHTYDQREEELGEERMRQLERAIMLRVIDQRWIQHLTALDELRRGIGLRAVSQRDPLVEYKREAYDAFERLMADIQSDVANFVFNVRLVQRPQPRRQMRYSGASGGAAGSSRSHQPVRKALDVGRNDPCPCGSGKKYKHCCLREGLSPEEAAAKGQRSQRVIG